MGQYIEKVKVLSYSGGKIETVTNLKNQDFHYFKSIPRRYDVISLRKKYYRVLFVEYDAHETRLNTDVYSAVAKIFLCGDRQFG
ncbi:MAG TPA: hypothetical protein VIN07_09555 [Flavipsychrobacter sp.]